LKLTHCTARIQLLIDSETMLPFRLHPHKCIIVRPYREHRELLRAPGGGRPRGAGSGAAHRLAE
jgi:hypothetical protein